MTALELLRLAGAGLYGPRWQTDLAAALRVSDRTIRRWSSGDEIPAGVWSDLAGIVAARQGELEGIAKALAERIERA